MPATDEFPLLLDPAALVERLDDPALRVIDLSPGEVFGEHHVPGAVHLPYGELVTSRPPVGGLLPDDTTLCASSERPVSALASRSLRWTPKVVARPVA